MLNNQVPLPTFAFRQPSAGVKSEDNIKLEKLGVSHNQAVPGTPGVVPTSRPSLKSRLLRNDIRRSLFEDGIDDEALLSDHLQDLLFSGDPETDLLPHSISAPARTGRSAVCRDVSVAMDDARMREWERALSACSVEDALMDFLDSELLIASLVPEGSTHGHMLKPPSFTTTAATAAAQTGTGGTMGNTMGHTMGSAMSMMPPPPAAGYYQEEHRHAAAGQLPQGLSCSRTGGGMQQAAGNYHVAGRQQAGGMFHGGSTAAAMISLPGSSSCMQSKQQQQGKVHQQQGQASNAMVQQQQQSAPGMTMQQKQQQGPIMTAMLLQQKQQQQQKHSNLNQQQGLAINATAQRQQQQHDAIAQQQQQQCEDEVLQASMSSQQAYAAAANRVLWKLGLLHGQEAPRDPYGNGLCQDLALLMADLDSALADCLACLGFEEGTAKRLIAGNLRDLTIAHQANTIKELLSLKLNFITLFTKAVSAAARASPKLSPGSMKTYSNSSGTSSATCCGSPGYRPGGATGADPSSNGSALDAEDVPPSVAGMTVAAGLAAETRQKFSRLFASRLRENAFHIWALLNILDPKPSRQDKELLATYTNKTTKQVTDWFTNFRARHWRPAMQTLAKQVLGQD